MQPVIIISFIVACGLFQQGSALNCYSCDSSKGIACNYGLLSIAFPSVECKADTGSSFLDNLSKSLPANCIKLVGIAQDGSEYVARSCAPSTGPINSCDIVAKAVRFADQKDLKQLDCYECNTDNCNAGNRHITSSFAFAGLVVACLAFMI